MRISNCCSLDNNFIVADAWNRSTGEAYDATGQFWSCGSKLCPNCIAKKSRETRRKLREAISRQVLRKGERYYFPTFTIPNPGASLIETRHIVDRTWQLFRKRKLCVSLVKGWAKSEEFTLTKVGYHYHLHCLWLAKYIQFQEVRRVWTECLEVAFAEAQRELVIDTKDGLAIVVFGDFIVNGRKSKTATAVDEKTVQEIAKYITKSDSWAKMNSDHLAEVALVKRWHRMFELGGSFKPESEDTTLDDAEREAFEPIVHTRSLSDGSSRRIASYWRDRVAQIGLDRYTDELNSEISNVWEVRKEQIAKRWPGAKMITLRDLG